MDLAILILVICSAISALCSILTLWVIYRLQKLNGYIFVIINLTVSQLFYDISILMVPSKGRTIEVIYVTIRSICGLSTTFWTNVISSVILYTVYHRKVYNVNSHKGIISLLVIIPAVVIGGTIGLSFSIDDTSEAFTTTSDIYYWIRIGSIVFNMIIYVILSAMLFRRNRGSTPQEKAKDPVRVIANRMKYYPIVQVITRLGVAWYEYKYGHNYSYSPDISTSEKIALFLYVTTLPAAGLGYFVIFMSMSPGAWTTLKKDLLHPLINNCCIIGLRKIRKCIFGYDDEPLMNGDHMSSNKVFSNNGIDSSSGSRFTSGSLLTSGEEGYRESEYTSYSDEEATDEIMRLYSGDGSTTSSKKLQLDRTLSNIVMDSINV
jgi:hypothetical protein